MSTQVQSLRLMLDFNYSAMQAGRIVRSILSSKHVLMLILLELFAIFFEVHYKVLQRILQNVNAGGLLSWWSFFRVDFCPGLAFSVVFCPVDGGLLSVHQNA